MAQTARAIREEKATCYWPRLAPDTMRPAGIRYGYWNLIAQVEKALDHDKSSRIALHCTPVASYHPDPDGRTNILLTMWESRDLRADDLVRLRQVDAIITPSKFCVELYKRHVDVPVYHVPLGVDTDLFQYRARARPTGRFRWLWMASPDPRKGWGAVAIAWKHLARMNVELYMKTSATGMSELKSKGNVTIDCRNVETQELVELMHSAHGFLYPSSGEGFGLTAIEAMATGLPIVSTMWSGHADFVNPGTAWIIDHKFQRRANYGPDIKSVADDGLFELALPSIESMVGRMMSVMKHYNRAQTKARNAARLIASKYTWTLFARRLGDVIRLYD